jgi:ABC-type nickel/cobalt efflux system permease component RcnA
MRARDVARTRKNHSRRLFSRFAGYSPTGFILAATTTITHPAGVFAVGGIALFASNLINSEKLDPWLSLISGLLVPFIGLSLLLGRSKTRFVVRKEFLKKIKTKIFNKNSFLRTKLLTTNR